MRIKISFFFSFLFSFIPLFVFANQIDSLYNEFYRGQGDPEKKLEVLVEIIKYYEKKEFKIDSLEKYLSLSFSISSSISKNKEKEVSNLIGYLYKVKGFLLFNKGDIDSAIFYINQILNLKGINDSLLLFNANNNLGILYETKGDLKEALNYYQNAIQMAKKLHNPELLAKSYYNMAILFRKIGNYPKAIDAAYEALKNFELLQKQEARLSTLIVLGNLYMEQNKVEEADSIYSLILGDIDSARYSLQYADVLTNLGQLYLKKDELLTDTTAKEIKKQLRLQAIQYYQRAGKIYEALNKKVELANVYLNLANAYLYLDQYLKALEYLNKAMNFYERLKIKTQLAKCYLTLSIIYQELKEYPKALLAAQKAQNLSLEIGSKPTLSNALKELSSIYQKMGDYKNAFRTLAKHVEIYKELINEEQNRLLYRYEAAYEFEKKKQQLEFEQRQKDLLHQQELKRQALIRNFSLLAFFLVLLIAVILYRNFKKEKEIKLLILKQKEEVERQKTIIEKKNQDIMESMQYAQRIQNTILTSQSLLNLLFPEHFLLYQPKDIVSGDFYWAKQIGNRKLVAVGDCTGHGVPAALLSVLGVELLNEIIEKNPNFLTHEILNALRERLMDIMGYKELGTAGRKEGMDISLILYDEKERKLYYSGAYNSCYIIRNQQNEVPFVISTQTYDPNAVRSSHFSKMKEGDWELIEIKADKQPIGIHFAHTYPFSYHVVEIIPHDRIYLFTDGYADQFGGPRGRKLTYGRFKKILLNAQNYPIGQQKEVLYQTLTEWQQDIPQIDDITVVGIEIT